MSQFVFINWYHEQEVAAVKKYYLKKMFINRRASSFCLFTVKVWQIAFPMIWNCLLFEPLKIPQISLKKCKIYLSGASLSSGIMVYAMILNKNSPLIRFSDLHGSNIIQMCHIQILLLCFLWCMENLLKKKSYHQNLRGWKMYDNSNHHHESRRVNLLFYFASPKEKYSAVLTFSRILILLLYWREMQLLCFGEGFVIFDNF